jgi:hypothetical protein
MPSQARIFRGGGIQVLNRQDLWCRRMRPRAGRVHVRVDEPAANASGGQSIAGEIWLTQSLKLMARKPQACTRSNAGLALALPAPSIFLNHCSSGGVRSLPRGRKWLDRRRRFLRRSKGTTSAPGGRAQRHAPESRSSGGTAKRFRPTRAGGRARRAVVLIGRDREDRSGHRDSGVRITRE